MKKIIFITPPDANPGFGLTGVVQIITDPHEAETCLRKAMEDADVGLAAIDERLLNSMDREKLHILEKHWSGVLVVLPPPAKELAPEEDYGLRLIARAIGYHVRLGA